MKTKRGGERPCQDALCCQWCFWFWMGVRVVTDCHCKCIIDCVVSVDRRCADITISIFDVFSELENRQGWATLRNRRSSCRF